MEGNPGHQAAPWGLLTALAPLGLQLLAQGGTNLSLRGSIKRATLNLSQGCSQRTRGPQMRATQASVPGPRVGWGRGGKGRGGIDLRGKWKQ